MMQYSYDHFFHYATSNRAPYVVELGTNLGVDTVGFVDVFDRHGFILLHTFLKTSGSSALKITKNILYNKQVKLIVRPFDSDGVYWADNFILQDGVVNIDFRSQGESDTSGELKAFSGSLTQDGQPVSRSVYALAIGGEVPKLLASSVSDDAGSYSLEWNGYTGQILITATDDYGVAFTAETLLSVGARVHPATPNGYIYEAASAGVVGLEDPVWPTIEGQAVTSGEVQLVAKPFYRPKSAGPFIIT
jgi:hypothetical protein